MTVNGQNSRPPTGNFVTVSEQFLVTADTNRNIVHLDNGEITDGNG